MACLNAALIPSLPRIQAIASCKEAFRARYGPISQSLFEELAATRMSV